MEFPEEYVRFKELREGVALLLMVISTKGIGKTFSITPKMETI